MIMKYIKQDQILSFDFELDSKYNIGSSYEDYVAGKYVKLSDAQVKFYENNPSANISEVWNMAMVSHERTLEQAKAAKIAEIEAYDSSSSVNAFTVNGTSLWLDKDTRSGLILRFNAEKSAGKTETKLWLGNNSITLAIDDAIKMLYALEVYASACYDNTATHKANVSALTTVEEVMNYDYKTGYPNKLEFK